MVTWGTSPEDALPDHRRACPTRPTRPTPSRREAMQRALAYMGLQPGQPLTDVAIDRVFIGSCTNGRIEDLRSAADVARGRRVAAGVEAWVVPGSGLVKRQAEAEGLDRVFIEAGFQWRHAGCSMCLGTNGDQVAPGQRCASTSNRNFVGRQGPGARTHLMSPAMAAAAAVTGRLSDVRALLAVRDMEPFRQLERRGRAAGAAPTSTPTRSCRRAICKSRASTNFGEYLFRDVRHRCARASRGRTFRSIEPAYAQARDPGGRAQLRLRLVARAGGVGAFRRWLSRRDRAELRRHLLFQRTQERPAADRCCRKRVVDALLDCLARSRPAPRCASISPTQTVAGPDLAGHSVSTSIAFSQHCLLEGLDEIDYTLSQSAQIEAFERAMRLPRPDTSRTSFESIQR